VLVIVEVAGAADRGFHGPKVCDAAVADRYAIESERDRVGGGLRIRSSASIPVVEMGVLRNTEIFSALPAASLERGCA